MAQWDDKTKIFLSAVSIVLCGVILVLVRWGFGGFHLLSGSGGEDWERPEGRAVELAVDGTSHTFEGTYAELTTLLGDLHMFSIEGGDPDGEGDTLSLGFLTDIRKLEDLQGEVQVVDLTEVNPEGYMMDEELNWFTLENRYYEAYDMTLELGVVADGHIGVTVEGTFLMFEGGEGFDEEGEMIPGQDAQVSGSFTIPLHRSGR